MKFSSCTYESFFYNIFFFSILDFFLQKFVHFQRKLAFFRRFFYSSSVILQYFSYILLRYNTPKLDLHICMYWAGQVWFWANLDHKQKALSLCALNEGGRGQKTLPRVLENPTQDFGNSHHACKKPRSLGAGLPAVPRKSKERLWLQYSTFQYFRTIEGHLT